ncbi:P-loop containing nucleoside triphosphate hydrolase protein [Pluteus cervinus]|uniref:P-loop containing nucleoside triphosphate hydrolase protein n=1 Tax=Pluteus cervinus TaxID=181527 RepID=A0ACD3B404_9AGAR|nr:P-loop containing nucleoside triphosphate hydrolase protein [Pluteus cervinus]
MSSNNLENPSTTEANPIKKRIGRYDYYFNTRTNVYALRRTAKPQKPKASHKKCSLIVRRRFDDRGRYMNTVVDIKSPQLCDVLLEINEDVEGLDLDRHEPTAEPELFFHSYLDLKARLDAEQTKDLRDDALILDIAAAIQFTEEDQGENIRNFVRLTAQKEITYDLLWALFKPNCIIYHRHPLIGQPMLLQVSQTYYAQRENRTRYMALICRIISDDGQDFGYAQEEFELNAFPGARRICELTAYPLSFHPDEKSVWQRAVDLGREYASMSKHSYRDFHGFVLQELEEPQTQSKKLGRLHVSGRVMISPSSFSEHEPNCKYNPYVSLPLQKEGLTEEQYALCTPIRLGFSFERKSWGGFSVDRLKDVRWDDKAFESLVLGQKQKKLIHGLVKQHALGAAGFDDIISGKGKSLVGLLAGKPGCGKTLTAEAVAETTHKPLYTISAGELGVDPDSVESRLASALKLAQAWDAVLLLDEAEVFLQRRSPAHIKRNALVAIFLRHLEYYQGIMILTTNMAEQIDPAFESRIHFSVRYADLTFDARKSIWKTFFDRSTVDIDEEQLNRLAEHKINGRQIKNAFSSAQTIALANDSPKFTVEDIDVVLEVLHDWKAAVKADAEEARREKEEP